MAKAKPSLSFTATSARTADLREAKAELSRRYLPTDRPQTTDVVAFSSAISADPNTNVVGIGIGEKVSDGKPLGVLAVKIFVRSKVPLSSLTAREKLPESIDGLPTDVEETGLILPLAKKKAATKPAPLPAMPNPRQKSRPTQPGCSVGFRLAAPPAFRMAGTFGALVTHQGKPCVLSNNHVLAHENQLPLESSIFQPGLLDGGKPKTDEIARLSKFIPLRTQGSNDVDAALAELTAPANATRDVLFIGPPAGMGQAAMDQIVHKFGRTTSYTVGRVVSVDTDISVAYGIGNLVFADQIVIRSLGSDSFSKAGDSGSLILTRPGNQGVGLLFAGSASHTIANHLDKVLASLDAQLM